MFAIGCAASGPVSSKSASTVKRDAGSQVASSVDTDRPCRPARVRYDHYPGGADALAGLPWVAGEPAESGLVALLWYWPRDWQRQRLREARIFTGGVAPAGYNVKVMWVFLSAAARGRGGSTIAVEGRRVDGQRTFRQEFTAIGYEGQNEAPSFASIIDVPATGCWRLTVSTGDLSASVDLRAVRGKR